MSTIASLWPPLAASVLLLAPSLLVAQESAPRDTVGPQAGQWAAEVGAGTGLSGTLLRFRSAASAWLLGVDASFAQIRQELPDPLGGGTRTESSTQVDAFARIGLRQYRTTQGALRPFTSGGLLGGTSRADGSRSWAAGIFAELGAAYLFSPHVSLGASGGLRASYGETRGDSPLGGPSFRARVISVNASAVQMLGAVYF
jgi:hypothetical protein